MGRCRAGVGRWREAVRSMSPNTEEVAPQERQRPQGSRYQVVPAGSFRDLESEPSAAQQGRLPEESPEFVLVDRDGWGPGVRPRAGRRSPRMSNDSTQPPATRRISRATARRTSSSRIEERHVNCVTRSNSPSANGSSVALPTCSCERRVALPPLGDPVFHQVDSVRLASSVVPQTMEEVPAAAADVEDARPCEGNSRVGECAKQRALQPLHVRHVTGVVPAVRTVGHSIARAVLRTDPVELGVAHAKTSGELSKASTARWCSSGVPMSNHSASLR